MLIAVCNNSFRATNDNCKIIQNIFTHEKANKKLDFYCTTLLYLTDTCFVVAQKLTQQSRTSYVIGTWSEVHDQTEKVAFVALCTFKKNWSPNFVIEKNPLITPMCLLYFFFTRPSYFKRRTIYCMHLFNGTTFRRSGFFSTAFRISDGTSSRISLRRRRRLFIVESLKKKCYFLRFPWIYFLFFVTSPSKAVVKIAESSTSKWNCIYITSNWSMFFTSMNQAFIFCKPPERQKVSDTVCQCSQNNLY